MTKPTDATVKAWARLLRAHQSAFSSVESALKDADLPPLSWYDVLLELEHAGNRGVRPFELEHALLLPQYGISRLIERIEKAGYLKRETCNDDGRGQYLLITATGKNSVGGCGLSTDKQLKRLWAQNFVWRRRKLYLSFSAN